ncbi:hypothetical protein PT974_03711 [Cladobotryum mycophilum]|uniref:GTP binding protein n=1 Tax=Cladobotryum mycophilum TaxID=491253 RepID=A0ABR0ST70_9HYPO
MTLTPQDIADLLQREGSNVHPDKYDEDSETDEAMQRRTELLIPVLATCQEVWTSGSEEIDVIAEKLGDGSRDVAWRGPLGDSGILEYFLRILASDNLRQGLQVHALRLIGNSCADTDENREIYESLIPFTIPVLFNILVDYAPAQLLASQSLLNQQLLKLLSSPSLSNYVVFIPYFCKILALLISQEGEAGRADPNTVTILFKLATSQPSRDDLDDFITLVAVAVSYLANPSFQTTITSGPHMKLFTSTIHHAYTHFDISQVDEQETVDQLKKLRSSLLGTLADITGYDAFASLHPLDSRVPQILLGWLNGGNQQLQAAACIALGNLSRSDDISVPLVRTHSAHVPLIRLLSDPGVSDAQLFHSSLSFLKNLAIPTQNKPLLAGLLDPFCVPRIYGIDTSPQVQFAAVSLTRLLLVNCPANVGRICAPLSADPSSPARERSSVSSILALFDRSDAEPTRLEAARAIASVCRVLHTAPVASVLPQWIPEGKSDEEEEDGDETDPKAKESKRREYFYDKHLDISKALAFLITQQKWPILRSEAWFVLALMCRSKEGCGVVLGVLRIHGAMEALCKSITGRDSLDTEKDGKQIEDRVDPEDQLMAMADGLALEPQQVDPKQKESMTRVDRENALVMCTELLRPWGIDIPSPKVSLLQDWVKEGTEIVVAQKAKEKLGN